jgi:FtsH-binding integral membrane protein
MIINNKTVRTKSVLLATTLFVIFGLLALVIGAIDVIDPPYPYAQRLPILGHIAFTVGILSLIASTLLWKLKRLGGYIGVVSFIIAYIVNIYVGEHPVIHALAGTIVGLILLVPLVLAWRSLS